MPLSGLKARLARTFLNFLDEHGEFRSALEEAAARAAAAEANSLWARDRRGRKKKKRSKYGGKLNDGETEEEEDDDLLWEEIDGPVSEDRQGSTATDKHPHQLPEDPYEQIQFYFTTFTQRTKLQIREQLELYQTKTQNWLHDELHHSYRVPLFSASMLLATLTLYTLRVRSKKIRKMVRVHSILGKKFSLKEYIHTNFIRGWVLLEHSPHGQTLWMKLCEKAQKAEMAALASMSTYQRRKFERFMKLETVGEGVVVICLLFGMLTCGITLVMSLNTLWMGGAGSGDFFSSVDVPNNGFETAKEAYDSCGIDAEFQGSNDPTSFLDILLDSTMIEDGLLQQEGAGDNAPDAPFRSPLRTKINIILKAKLGLPSSLAGYITNLRTQTIVYLTSFFTFLLFLASHYLAHKLHMALMHNDPMKHFVLSSDTTVKADGTVEAKRGETEAQRKRRERMLQAERLKAQMAQLAMEAKQAVEARRKRIDGDAAVEKEKEEEQKKQVEEREEIVRMHSKQFMMIKAGVPEVAIMNTLLAEGIEDESERKDIIDKLRAIKLARAEEAQRVEEAEVKRLGDEKKQEEEKELIAKERLRMAKAQKRTTGRSAVKKLGSFSQNSSVEITPKNDGGVELRKRLEGRKTPASSIVSSNDGESNTTSSTAVTKPTTMPPKAAPFKSDKEVKRSPSIEISPKTPSPPASRRESLTASGAMKSLLDTTPKKSNMITSNTVGDEKMNAVVAGHYVTNDQDKDSMEEEKKIDTEFSAKEKPLPPPMPSAFPSQALSTKSLSMETNVALVKDNRSKEDNGDADSRSSSPPPILVRITASPDNDERPQSFDFNSPLTSWAERPSACDILATITAVENAPNEEVNEEGGGAKTVDLSPSWLHTPAFERAVRNSNASWDRRPSSRDVIAKIRAVEMLEAKQEEKSRQDPTATAVNHRPRRGLRNSGLRQQQLQLQQSTMIDESLGIVNEGLTSTISPSTSFDVKQKVGKSGSEDDEISELSEPTYQSLEQRAFKGRSIPQSLYVLQPSDAMTISPMVSSSSFGISPCDRKPVLAMERMVQMAKEGEFNLPAMSDDIVNAEVKEDETTTKVEDTVNKSEDNIIAVTEETEEQKQRRVKAEARAKKMEEIAARRNAGEDDDQSAVSGISKRLRTRRKKNVQLAAISQEECSVKTEESQKSEDKPVSSVKVESEEEKQRRMRADARAKKLEAIAASRNSGMDVDDDTAVSGISKRHRIRRKKSALAAVTPDERERNDWKKSVYGLVLNAEQVQWRNSIYTHVVNAETTRAQNIEVKREIEEQDAAAQRRRENKDRLDKKAKKFAARAERFHKNRREGGADNDGCSVVSSASMSMRRRTRKSTTRQSLMAVPLVEDLVVAPTAAPKDEIPAVSVELEKENLERNQWCAEIYANTLHADQNQWKKSIYNHVLQAEEERMKRVDMQAKIEKDRAIALAMKEKERKNALRVQKIENLKIYRDAGASGEGASTISQEDTATISAATKTKWKKRRKKAANKNICK